MKGVNYLVDDAGNKTHIVLDLSVWQATLQTVLGQLPEQPRKPGGLKQSFEAAGFSAESVGDAMLEPLSEEELKEWYDAPLFDETPS